MPKPTPERLPVTWTQVAAFRLARHHLAERAPKKSLLSVARNMGGAQAQLLSAAQLSLWARTRDLEISEIEQLMNKRLLVKAACLRRTLFLVPSKDLAVFVRGTARRAEKDLRWARGRGISERVLDAAIDAALNVLDEPRTRSEIAERVSRALGVGKQSVHGGGWGSRRKVAAVPVGHLTYPVVDLLHLAATRGVFCYGPYRGNEPTFVRADAWIPRWQDLSAQEAEDKLLHWYLRSFGPATAADFALWTGMTLTEAREIWARQHSNLAKVDVEGWEASILEKDLEGLAQAQFERPLLRLLPYFDSYLLGHKEREHLAAVEHRPHIYRPQGWIAPVVLVDGRAAGVWQYTQNGNGLRLKVRKFGEISRRILLRIREEAEDLAHFLRASNVDIQFDWDQQTKS